MKKMTIAKLAALMAVLSTGVAQAATITDVNSQSVNVVFTDSAEIYHTLSQNGPFAVGSAAALGNPIVAVGTVRTTDDANAAGLHLAIQWGSSGDQSCMASGGTFPTTSCTIKNSQGSNELTFKLVESGGEELSNAGATADGWYAYAVDNTNAQLKYGIKLDAGTKAEGSYLLTVSASAYAA
jgi:hypothetical protein